MVSKHTVSNQTRAGVTQDRWRGHWNICLWRNISIPQTTSYSHFYQKQLQLMFHSGPSEHWTVQRNDNSGGGTIYFYTTWILFRNLTWILSQCGTWGKPWMSAVLMELCMNTTVMDGLEDMGHNGVNWKQSLRVRTDDLAAGLRRAPDWQHMAGVKQSFVCLSVYLAIRLQVIPTPDI